MSRRAKLEQMLIKDSGDPFLHFGLAMELVKEGLTAEALTHFDRVVELDPDYLAAYYHKGNTLIGAERLDEARQTLTAGIAAARAKEDGHALSEMEGLLAGIA